MRQGTFSLCAPKAMGTSNKRLFKLRDEYTVVLRPEGEKKLSVRRVNLQTCCAS